MKHTLLILTISSILNACSVNTPEPVAQEPEAETNTPTTGTTEDKNITHKGEFAGASGYTVTGTAQIRKGDDGKLTLELVNFRTSNGPDLRLYLAEDTRAKNFVEITNKVENGNKSYALGSNVDLSKQNTVLIWCKAFSVNFGSAGLKGL